MITVIVPTLNAADRLSACLAALVPAAGVCDAGAPGAFVGRAVGFVEGWGEDFLVGCEDGCLVGDADGEADRWTGGPTPGGREEPSPCFQANATDAPAGTFNDEAP